MGQGGGAEGGGGEGWVRCKAGGKWVLVGSRVEHSPKLLRDGAGGEAEGRKKQVMGVGGGQGGAEGCAVEAAHTVWKGV